MRGEIKTSFAYRASQFAEKNRDTVYCHCSRPIVAFSYDCYKIRFCTTCKRLIDDDTFEIIQHNQRVSLKDYEASHPDSRKEEPEK
jgi:hypothetical protein